MGCGTSSLKGNSYNGLNAQPTTYFRNNDEDATRCPLTQSLTTASAQTRPAPESTAATAPTDPNELTKKCGLYARYEKRRLGPGEPRDLVTGKGLYTGMTAEEVVKYVGGTRGAGIYGYSSGGIGVGGKERERALREDVQRAAAIRGVEQGGSVGDGKVRPIQLGVLGLGG